MAEKELEFFTRGVNFRVDGKAYVGLMTATAWGILQKAWGIPGLDAMQAKLGTIGFEEMGDIVWASLLKNHPKITREQGNHIADSMGMGVANYVSQVCSSSLPPGDAMVRDPTKPATRRRKAR